MGKISKIVNVHKIEDAIDDTMDCIGTDIEEVSKCVDTYQEWLCTVDYIQAYSYVPWLVKFVALGFGFVIYGVSFYQFWLDDHINIGLIIMMIFITLFIILVCFFNIILSIFLKAGDPKKYIAVVEDVGDSAISFDSKGSAKMVIFHIPEIDKYIRYETNTSKPCKFEVDEEYYVYVSDKFKLWDFVNKPKK